MANIKAVVAHCRSACTLGVRVSLVGTADAEMLVPSADSPELSEVLSVKPAWCSGSECSLACFAFC